MIFVELPLSGCGYYECLTVLLIPYGHHMTGWLNNIYLMRWQIHNISLIIACNIQIFISTTVESFVSEKPKKKNPNFNICAWATSCFILKGLTLIFLATNPNKKTVCEHIYFGLNKESSSMCSYLQLFCSLLVHLSQKVMHDKYGWECKQKQGRVSL